MAAALGRRFWTMWSAGAVSCLGDGVAIGAMPLLAVSLTRDPRLVTLVDVMSSVGWLVLGLVSGAIIDRVHRLQLMWQVDLLRALVTGVFAVLVFADLTTLALLYGYALLIGLLRPFFDTAATTVVPELVQRAHLDRANSATQMALVVGANLLGPPLGTLLFLQADGMPFLVDAGTFLVGALLLIALSRRTNPPAREPNPASLRSQISEGIQYLVGSPILRTLSIAVAMVNLVLGGMIAILVLYVLDVLHQPPAIYGWLVSTFALGGIVGAGAAPRLARRLGPGSVALGALLGFAIASLIVGFAHGVTLLVVALFVAGLSSVTWNVVTISYRQRSVPDELLGRVTSVYRMVALLAVPLGAAGAGMLAHYVGIEQTYLIGGTLLLVTAGLVGGRILQIPAVQATSVTAEESRR